jgi:phosphoenolpyruvate synthase
MSMSAAYVRTFEELGKRDISAAGGKGANLGEMTRAGLPVPPGFVLTTNAYDAFIQHHGLQEQIIQTVSNAQANDLSAVEKAADEIRQLFLDATIPDDMAEALAAAYAELGTGKSAAVAVRSSATAEDLPAASFAGQQETYLNVQGVEALLVAVKLCWASLWTARAISYRARQGVAHHAVAMGVVVQTMAPVEVAGILFTANPATGARDELVINASFGLGEAIVSGEVSPDSYVVDRESLTPRELRLGAKEMMIVAADQNGDGERTKQQPVPAARQGEAALEERLLSELAALGLEVEELFGAPQDIEWPTARSGCYRLAPLRTCRPPPCRMYAGSRPFRAPCGCGGKWWNTCPNRSRRSLPNSMCRPACPNRSPSYCTS